MSKFDPEDYEHLINSRWTKGDETFLLYGIMYGEDDWYWYMRNLSKGKDHFVSCVFLPDVAGYVREDIPF